ncbi:MAG: hypothetical protein KJO24_02885, partial [Gammaproteobacteria bacterium]|nr:hypothetical protein [Gammaproteobacteria bacterium]
RVLRGGGVLAMNTLLDGSLSQLREASASLGKHQHVNSFTTELALQALVQDLPFDVIEWQVSEHRQCFQTTSALLRSINGIGAGNHMQGRAAGLMGKTRFAQFCNALEQQRNANGELELGYRVLGLVLRAQA